MDDIVATKFFVLKDELNERQRRLWSASEAISLGHGGITKVSKATGLSRTTITQGINDLQSKQRLGHPRVRRVGGGRKKVTAIQPNLLSSLDSLVEPTAKGDPMSPLRWTTKSTRRLGATLNELGFRVSHMQVSRLLHELEYQLSANRKSLEGGTNPDRNTQFEFINEQSAKFLKQNCPVISVDAKKKELIGNYKQNGKVWGIIYLSPISYFLR